MKVRSKVKFKSKTDGLKLVYLKSEKLKCLKTQNMSGLMDGFANILAMKEQLIE